MRITGEATLFCNEYGNYSTSVSNKKEDGTYENMYIAVNLKKGVNIPNKTKINIKDGFLSFYINKEKVNVPKIVIMDFTTDLEKPKEEKKIEPQENFCIVPNSEELPF